MAYRVSVVIEKDNYGYYAFSPEIEGCQTQGESLEDVIERTKKTIKQYLEPHAEHSTRKLDVVVV
jgi:predicted RNase H-like HicB family nuclease